LAPDVYLESSKYLSRIGVSKDPQAHLLRTSFLGGLLTASFRRYDRRLLEDSGLDRVGRLLKLAAISSACNWAVAPR